MELQQLGVGQPPWIIVQLDELFGTAMDGPRLVIHKTEIETTFQQKSKNCPFNFGVEYNINRLQKKQQKFIVHPERHFHQMKIQEWQHILQTVQFLAKQGLLEQNQQIFRQHLLHNSREILFVNQKWKRKEEGHLSEVMLQSQMLLLSQTRTRVKISSEDSQVRAPRTVPTDGNSEQNKREYSYPGNHSQDNNGGNITKSTKHGNGAKNNSLSWDVDTSKRSGIHKKGFFLLFKSEDSEKRLQERVRICPFSGSREEEIVQTEKLEEELRKNIKEQMHPEQAKWFNKISKILMLHEKWREILDANSLNKEIQKTPIKMNGTNQVRDLIRKGDWATSLDLKSAFHHLIIYPPHRPYLAFEAIRKVYQYRAMLFETQHSPMFFAQALAVVLTKIRRESDI
ncbi:MAG: hypothetical protein EZS28_001293 [Streblomastix strix]|uniref:Reverse transcriptase domain-containing protein n=1 Tax=Streblomastix strix TaxID=222440 RepID=A0A5J4X7I4_9EUKA|nr:MAG: hypothetical protein EZS28_001293 [Streblomastix strix]